MKHGWIAMEIIFLVLCTYDPLFLGTNSKGYSPSVQSKTE